MAVIYGYMFWGNLVGEKTPGGKALAYLSNEFVEVEEFINAVKAKQAMLAEKKQHSAEPEIENRQITAASSEPGNPEAARRNIEQAPVSISYRHNQMRVKQNSDGKFQSVPDAQPDMRSGMQANSQSEPQPDLQAKVSEAEVDSADKQAVSTSLPIRQRESAQNNVPSAAIVDAAGTNDTFVSEQVEQQLENVDKNGNVIKQALPGNAIREVWITARKAFYQRDYALSEKSYRTVIANTTDNFDAYGELGNVYFNQGKKKEAAAEYFEAAAILAQKGQTRRAKSLLGLLNHLDKGKADELRKLLSAS